MGAVASLQELEAQSKKKRIQSLVEMGFDKNIAEQAVSVTNEVQEAIDWIQQKSAVGQEVDMGKVETLKGFGFTESMVHAALSASNNDLDQALEMLLAQQQL